MNRPTDTSADRATPVRATDTLAGSRRSTAATRETGGSIFEIGRNCRAVAAANRLALLVDAADYFKVFAEAAERARHSIIILSWDFNSRTQLRWTQSDSGAPPLLGDFVNFLVRRRRGLHVYILNWDYPMVFGTDREFPPIYGLGEWTPRRRVHFEYDNTHPVGGSHHQKIVVIDDALAFSGGLDLTCRRWDTCEHKADDPRRKFDEVAYPPFHDVMIAVDGEAARALANVARERWRRATGRVIAPAPAGSDPWPEHLRPALAHVEVAVSCTFPDNDAHQEAREVEALYFDMIARAKRYLYIENQYFTAERIGAALAARLAEPDGPEIIVVSRLLSHGWLEEHTMHVLRSDLVRQLQAADRWKRFGIYYPHVPGLAPGTCVDVHSKVMIADDEWLRVGSANLCNRSMGLDTECDVTLEARGEARVSDVIRDFRNRLLAEHLHVAPERVVSEIERHRSLHGVIRALHCNGSTLRPLDGMPEWSDTVVNLAQVADLERPVSLDQLVTEFAPDLDTRESGPAWDKLLLAAVVVVALAAAWRYTPLAELITPDRIGDWSGRFASAPWAPWAVLLAYTPAALLMFPRPLITLFSVLAFGPWLAFTYAIVGTQIAALVPYVAGRMMDRSTVRHLAGHKLNRISDVLRRRGLFAMTALRLVPMAPFAVESLVAGAVRIRTWHLMLGTLIGHLPGAIVATFFGEQLNEALTDPGRINYWVVGMVVIVFAVGMLMVRHWFKRQMAKPAAYGR